MRSDIVRIYKAVHTWTGIISGLALFIAFYAGAITVFKEPLTRWVSPPVERRLVPLADTPRIIVDTLAAHPQAASEFTIHLRDDEDIPARMSWQVREAGADEHDTASVRHYKAEKNLEGFIEVSEFSPNGLATFIDVLHRVVGLPVDNDENRWVMGIIAALYTLALISGVIVLLPSLVKDFLALRVGKNLKRMWLDAHNILGIVSLPFHLVMALTAAVFAFHDGIYFLQDKLVHDGKWSSSSQRQRSAAFTGPGRDPATMLSPEQLVGVVAGVSPGFAASMLQYQQLTGPRPSVRVWGKDSAAVAPRARGGFAVLDPYCGKIISKDLLPGHQNTPNLIISSFFALHMASFGSAIVQWMYFLLALAGAWLFYSGNLLWVESRRNKQSKQDESVPAQRRDVRLLAAATVGVSLGCVCGISLLIVAGKWLNGRVSDPNVWYPIIYYGTFFACIAWAFLRGAAKASIDLLWLAAALTFAIPMTSLLASMVSPLDVWGHRSSACLGVDATALAGALLFAFMARKTSLRVRFGPTDSVWSSRSPRA